MNTTNFLLLAVSLSAAVLGTSINNKAAKQWIKNQNDNLLFNLLLNIMSTICMLAAARSFRAHSVTVFLAFVFGLCNMLSGICFTMVFRFGPMSLSSLITSAGTMIETTVLGVIIFHEKVAGIQIAGILLILVSIGLLFNPGEEGNIRPVWFFFIFLYWLFGGSLGIIQKLQGATGLSGEKTVFLLYTFIFCSLFNAIWLFFSNRREGAEKITISIKSILLFTVIAGLTTAAQHIINLKLAIEMPAAVFFPINSGASIILCSLVSSFYFHEKITVKQKASLAIGFAAMFLVAGIFG